MKRADADLQQAVTQELQWDTRISAADIAVHVQHGVVTLTGSVESWGERTAAQDAAHRVEGALDVANELQVRAPAVPTHSDAQIARAVRHALEWNVFVPDRQIRSTVSRGWVTLEGDVDYLQQRDDAERAVTNLNGVIGVTNKLQIEPHAHAVDIQRAVEGALERRAQREAARIQVEVCDGEVTLSGLVQSYAEKAAMLGAARCASGVRSVRDCLRIDLPAA